MPAQQTINLDQKRAAYAWECVYAIRNERWLGDYINLAKGAPALIMNNGLMQVMAFYWDKARSEKGLKEDKKYYAFLLDHLMKWLEQQEMLPQANYAAAMKFLHSEADTTQFRLAAAEALELLKWIRAVAPTVAKQPEDNL